MMIGGDLWHHPASRTARVTMGASGSRSPPANGRRARCIRSLAYPYGLWNPEAISHLQVPGVAAAFQLSNKTDPAEPLSTIRPYTANGLWLILQFQTAISSGSDAHG